MTDIHVTERSAFKGCRLYWDFNYVQGLTSLVKSTSHSWFGTGVHYALATYYRDKMSTDRIIRDPSVVFEQWFYSQFTEDEWNGFYDEKQKELNDWLELGQSMLSRYVEWADEHDDFEIIGVEMPIRYEIFPDIWIVGTLDLLVRRRRDRKLWVVDHKTVGSFSDQETLTFDDQMVTYLWLVWKVYDEVPGGALYSMLRKAIPVEPLLVYNGTKLSKAKNIDTTYDKYMEAIKRNNFDPTDYEDILQKVRSNEFFRREPITRSRRELEIFSTQIPLEVKEMTRSEIAIYPTMTRDCVWSCQYKDLCRTRLTGGDVTFTINTHFGVREDSDDRLRWQEAQGHRPEPGVVNAEA